MSLGTRRAVALAAAAESLPVDVAGTLIAEATLLLERLDRRRIRSAAALLDRAAGRSRPTGALSAASADYLRALSCRTWRRNQPELELPLRVLERLDDRADELLARTELLASAIRWETAALLADRTMSCWGAETVLAGFRGAS